MEIRAKILEILDTVKVSEKFRKREFVVEYVPENSQYPEYLKFEMVQDKCEQLDGYKAGDEAQIQFNLKGRKWVNHKGENVYFNSLQAWKLVKAKAQDRGAEEDEVPPELDDEKGPPPEDDEEIPF